MFAIGFLLLFCLSFCENYNMRVAGNSDIRNVYTFFITFSGAVISLIIFLLLSYYNSTILEVYNKNIGIIYDPRFQITIVLEMFGIWLARKNHKVNKNNITAINFSLFFSLALVPIFAFLGDSILGFENTLKIGYKSNLEFVLFVSFMTLLTILYFIDKLKNEINNKLLLVLFPIVLSSTMFLSGKLMQTYESFFTTFLITFSVSIFYFLLALYKKEFSVLNREHTKPLMIICSSWMIALPMNTLAVKILAIEFVTLLKRMAQLIVGIILDKKYNKSKKIKLKDKIIIFFILFIGFLVYYYRT